MGERARRGRAHLLLELSERLAHASGHGNAEQEGGAATGAANMPEVGRRGARSLLRAVRGAVTDLMRCVEGQSRRKLELVWRDERLGPGCAVGVLAHAHMRRRRVPLLPRSPFLGTFVSAQESF